MLNRSASLAMSTSVLKALPGKLDIKRHSSNILYVFPIKYFSGRARLSAEPLKHRQQFKDVFAKHRIVQGIHHGNMLERQDSSLSEIV